MRRVVIAVFTLVTLSAHADVDLDFNDVDLNNDAAVQPWELTQSGLFAEHDLDGNGVLQVDELGHEPLFQSWDTDNNRDLAPREFYRGIFAFADTNRDQLLGPVEFGRTLVEWEGGEAVERPGWTGGAD